MASIIADATLIADEELADRELQAIANLLEIGPGDHINLNADFVFALEIGLELEQLAAVEHKIIAKLNLNGNGILSREAWTTFSAEWHASEKSLVEFMTTTEEDEKQRRPEARNGNENFLLTTAAAEGGSGCDGPPGSKSILDEPIEATVTAAEADHDQENPPRTQSRAKKSPPSELGEWDVAGGKDEDECVVFRHRHSGFCLELAHNSNGWSRLKESHEGKSLVEYSRGARNSQGFKSIDLIRQLESTPGAFPLQGRAATWNFGSWLVDASQNMVTITNGDPGHRSEDGEELSLAESGYTRKFEGRVVAQTIFKPMVDP